MYTGKPRQPANKRSKKRAWFALLITGFALAVDFTMAMMSIQAFYYSLRGPQSLFGLTFGAYDLGALLSLLSSLLLLLFKVTCLYADSRIPNRSLTLSLSLSFIL